MPLPKFHETFIPILEVLSDGKIIHYNELRKKVRDEHYSDLPAELLNQRTKSGDLIILNRIGWAKSYLKEGQIYKIEGGGKFGDLLREWMDKTKDVQYPGYPRPGSLYLWEIALGTHPKYFRRRAKLFDADCLFANVDERNRSGVFHWGIGVDDFDPEVVKYGKENKLPVLHVGHAGHTYFSTYEIKLRDTGEWVKMVDKGRLVALDDPEVRDLAAQYGDPDDLLEEDWIPAIPGINYPGDYMRDYGQDPVRWIKREHEGNLPDTIGVPE